MKKVRKGFTLIELLLVIAIMGILSVMGMIAGQETTSAARATVIADNLEKLKTAGEMFYSENAEEVDKTGTVGGEDVTATILAKGINNYLNGTTNKVAEEVGDNTYFAYVHGNGAKITWWVGYQFGESDGNDQIRKALSNKTYRMGLKKTPDSTETTEETDSEGNKTEKTEDKTAEAYEGGNLVYLKIH